jgi:hypothetical protein
MAAYEEQQFKVLMSENGVLDVTSESQTDLAARIRRLFLSGTWAVRQFPWSSSAGVRWRGG